MIGSVEQQQDSVYVASISDQLVDYLKNELGFQLSDVDLNELIERLVQSVGSFRSFEEFASTVSSLIAVHETYFLRHKEQFRWLETVWLERILEERKDDRRQVNILSAGCATGEEPYSIFAHLSPLLASAGIELHVDAVDISKQAIARAKQGRYGLWSLRGVNLENETAWLDSASRNVYVRDWVKDGVSFSTANITRPFKQENLSGYDLILCRNVMIYMHRDAIDSVLNNLKALLAPGGMIMPGPSDPNPGMEVGLDVRWEGGVRLFHSCTGPEVFREDPVNIENRESPFLDVEESFIAAEQVPVVMPEESIAYEQIEILIRSCQYDAARKALEEKIIARPLATRSYVMLTMLALEMDDMPLAQFASRKASFLNSDAPYTIYLLANYKQRVADQPGEKRCLEWVRERLADMDPGEPLKYCEDVKVAELDEVVRSRMQGFSCNENQGRGKR